MSTLEQVTAAMERGATMPVAGRRMAERWSRKTAETYVSEVRQAREWWETDRRTARQAAAGAGLERIPDNADAAPFMPWPPDRLARYVAHQAASGRAPDTIRKALAALRAWHRLHGIPLPDGLPALTVLQDHESNLAAEGWEPRRAEPITLDTALRLLRGCDRGTDRGRRDAALLMLGFNGMLSTTELSALDVGDVQLARQDGDVAALAVLRPVDVAHRGGRRRAAEPYATPTVVAIPHWRISGEHAGELCPVEAVAGWVDVLTGRGAGIASPLFRPIDRWGHIGGIDPAFAGGAAMLHEGGRLGAREIGEILRSVAEQAGIPADERPTMTELRLGGVVRRRLEGATVDELEAASGLATLLEHIRAAEHRRAAP